jgi:sugar lactone lactonase YvrE
MPNTTYLLNKLKNVSKISVQVPSPRDAVIDNYGYLVTVEVIQNQLDRFDPNNLTRIKQISVPGSEQYTITYFQGAYYIASYNPPMTVISSETLTVLGNISTSMYGIRSIIFLNNGQTMVVAACDSNSLGFLTRTKSSSIGYTLAFSQSTTFSCPHGMWRVNDSFFYVTSYTQNSLYSFRATSIYNQWIQTLVLSSMNTNGQGGAARVTIDECGRFWSTFEINTIFIHDQEGQYLGNWTLPNSTIFDIKIMDNYLIYLTDSNSNKTMRVDPGFQCYF